MKRRRLTAAQKAEIWKRQSFRCVCGCNARLTDGPIEYDHVIPLALGGADALDNIEALLATCHRVKTPKDIARIAKAKRQARFHETGRSHARKGRPLRSRGFDKALRKRMDGTVERIQA